VPYFKASLFESFWIKEWYINTCPIINPYTDTSILNYVRECNWKFYSRFCHTIEHKVEVKWQIIPQIKDINWETVSFWYFHHFPLSSQRTALVLLLSAILTRRTCLAHFVTGGNERMFDLVICQVRLVYYNEEYGDQGGGNYSKQFVCRQKCIRHGTALRVFI